jgi:transcriptional regulator with XRE-family HTH domain
MLMSLPLAVDRPLVGRRPLAGLDIGALIRRARTDAGITQQQLARALSTKQSVISRWERGLDVPRVDTLARILRACGFEADLSLRRLDDVDRSQITAALVRSPAERAAYFESVIDAYESAQRARKLTGVR